MGGCFDVVVGGGSRIPVGVGGGISGNVVVEELGWPPLRWYRERNYWYSKYPAHPWSTDSYVQVRYQDTAGKSSHGVSSNIQPARFVSW